MGQHELAEAERLLASVKAKADKLSVDAKSAVGIAEEIQETLKRVTDLVGRLAEQEQEDRLSR